MSAQTLEAIAHTLHPGALRVHTEPMAGGVSADVRALDVHTANGLVRYVARRKQGTIAREAAVLTALSDLDFPVPRPVCVDLGWLVMPRIEGSTAVTDLPAILRTMARFLIRLHDLRPLDVDLDLPDRQDPATEVGPCLPERFADLELPPQPRCEPCMLHGDFWPGNLLWREDTLVAVLDWEDVAVGDPASDLAQCRLELIYRYGQDAAEAFTAHYLEARAVDPVALTLWELHVAASCAAAMHQWGLAPDVEARMRVQANAFMDRAAAAL